MQKEIIVFQTYKMNLPLCSSDLLLQELEPFPSFDRDAISYIKRI